MTKISLPPLAPLFLTLAFLIFGAPAPAANVRCEKLLAAAAPAMKSVPRPARADLTVRRLEKTKSISFRTSDRRLIALQVVRPADAGQPTLLLMPGVNRGVLAGEKETASLAALGFGVATFHFSTQPFSVASLPEGETPVFRQGEPTLEDFAKEVSEVAAYLRATLGLKNVVPVSLSFSGAVSPFLKGFPLIIETAPLTSASAANPGGENLRSTLNLGLLFNPVFGPSMSRQTMGAVYRMVWSKQVESMPAKISRPATRQKLSVPKSAV